MIPLLLGGGVVALIGYGAMIEPRRFELSRHELAIAGWPAALDGFTILHLSDLHTRWRGPAERWLARLRGELRTPDLVAITGDLAETVAALPACLEALAGWPSRLGTFAVLGNNDGQSHRQRRAVIEALEAAGVRLLLDASQTIEHRGARFRLAGLRYPGLRFNIEGWRLPVEDVCGPADMPRILLTHSPDAILEASEAGIELVLSGHTHGGQICLPGGRPIRTNLHRYRPPAYGRGIYREGRTHLVVHRGLGMTRPLLRTCCRPEAILLTLLTI